MEVRKTLFNNSASTALLCALSATNGMGKPCKELLGQPPPLQIETVFPWQVCARRCETGKLPAGAAQVPQREAAVPGRLGPGYAPTLPFLSPSQHIKHSVSDSMFIPVCVWPPEGRVGSCVIPFCCSHKVEGLGAGDACGVRSAPRRLQVNPKPFASACNSRLPNSGYLFSELP